MRRKKLDKTVASKHDQAKRKNPSPGMPTEARPLFRERTEPLAKTLRHLVEVEVKSIKLPVYYLRTEPREPDGHGDPFFYDSESQVSISIDGDEVGSFIYYQGTSARSDRAYHSVLEYLQHHLRGELERTVIELYEEVRDFRPKQAVREQLILRRKVSAESGARRRLPPAKREVDSFLLVNKARDAISKLEATPKMRGLKTQIAKLMYPRSDNALQELKRQSKTVGITDFFDLLYYAGAADLAFMWYEDQKRRGMRE